MTVRKVTKYLYGGMEEALQSRDDEIERLRKDVRMLGLTTVLLIGAMVWLILVR